MATLGVVHVCLSDAGGHVGGGSSGRGGDTMRGRRTLGTRAISFVVACALMLNVLVPARAAFAAPIITLPGGTLSYPANSGPVVIDSGLTVASTPNNIQTVTVTIDTNYNSATDTLTADITALPTTPTPSTAVFSAATGTLTI